MMSSAVIIIISHKHLTVFVSQKFQCTMQYLLLYKQQISEEAEPKNRTLTQNFSCFVKYFLFEFSAIIGYIKRPILQKFNVKI